VTPLHPDKELAVILAAREWQVVLAALGDAPYRIASPIVQKIVGQVQPAPPAPSADRGNGRDDADVIGDTNTSARTDVRAGSVGRG
jgi:hypothetical protein